MVHNTNVTLYKCKTAPTTAITSDYVSLTTERLEDHSLGTAPREAPALDGSGHLEHTEVQLRCIDVG